MSVEQAHDPTHDTQQREEEEKFLLNTSSHVTDLSQEVECLFAVVGYISVLCECTCWLCYWCIFKYWHGSLLMRPSGDSHGCGDVCWVRPPNKKSEPRKKQYFPNRPPGEQWWSCLPHFSPWLQGLPFTGALRPSDLTHKHPSGLVCIQMW